MSKTFFMACSLFSMLAWPSWGEAQSGTSGRQTSGGGLDLALQQIVDISTLGVTTVGGAAFDTGTGSLWISDGGTSTNEVFELRPGSWQVISSFDASVVPGFTGGPDAVALHPMTGHLFVFSPFGQAIGGEVTQAGALVSVLGSPEAASAAFSPAGVLYMLEQTDATLLEVDPASGNTTASTPLGGFTGGITGADFDPVSGHLFAYAGDDALLLEIDVATAQVLSTTDMSPFLLDSTIPSGFAFNAAGTQIFFANGFGPGADGLLVLNVSPLLFQDGFESGGIAVWSAAVGASIQ